MVAPYRSGSRGDPGGEGSRGGAGEGGEGGEREERVGLGACLSSHPLRGPRGLVARILGRPPAVEVFEHGLVLWDGVRGRSEISFEDIDALHYDFEGLFAKGPPSVRLTTFGGEAAVVPRDVRDLDRVLGAIDRKVTRPIVTRAKEALARGDRLTFGPLEVELDGLVLRGESLPWSGLQRAIAEREVLVFYAHGPRGRFGWLRIADIPHPRALLAVLRIRTTVLLSGLHLPGDAE
jgi:hypothetical protein